MGAASQIQLSISELCAVLGVVFGAFALVVRMLLAQVSKRLEERLSQLASTAAKLERDAAELNRLLPVEYVRREDYIRLVTTIDAKLDRIHDRLDGLGKPNV